MAGRREEEAFEVKANLAEVFAFPVGMPPPVGGRRETLNLFGRTVGGLRVGVTSGGAGRSRMERWLVDVVWGFVLWWSCMMVGE